MRYLSLSVSHIPSILSLLNLRFNLAALKVITRKGAVGKSQLKEGKAGPMNDQAAEISQLHKMHEAMGVQREEMKKKREHFQLEIEMLEDKIKELEEKRDWPSQKQEERERRSTSEYKRDGSPSPHRISTLRLSL